MLIIVEGPDGAGKTTLVTELGLAAWREGYGSVLVNPKRAPRQDTLVEYAVGLDFYRPDGRRVLILDRSWLSEDVYGPLWRDGGGLHPTVRTYLNAWAHARGALLVRLDVDDEELERRLAARGDDDVAPEDAKVYAARYREQAIEWPGHRLNPTVDQVIGRATERQQDAAHLAGVRSYVGARHPDLVFLGDAKSPSVASAGFTTCFPPTVGSAAREVLWPAITELTPNGNDFGVLNANEEDIAGAYEALGSPVVICLGREAEKAAASGGVPVRGTVPHPQYIKRFHYARRREYLELLARAWDGTSTYSLERTS
jgi:hypothetical protein